MAEDIGSLAVKIALDSTTFEQGMQNLKRSLATIDSSFKASMAGIKDWGSKITGLKANMEQLSEKINVQKQIVEKYNQQMEKSKQNLQENAQKMMELKTKVDSAKNAWQQSAATLGKNDQATIKLKGDLDKLKQEYTTQETKVKNNSKTIEGYGIQVNNATAKLKNMQAQLRETNKELLLQQSQLIKSGESLQKTGGATKTLGSGFTSAGQTLSMAVTAPIVGIGAAIVKVGSDFDSQMSRVKAISGATGQDFTNLRNLAIQLGADTAFSSKEAAGGMENLASAGFKTEEIMKAMPGMLDLAASGGIDISTASDIAASALRGFGIDAGQAGHVADVLAKAAADTNADVGGMGEAFKYAAPVAHSLGLSLEEVSAAVGVMADVGIKGEQAGTTLRGALTRLASPAKPAADMMQALGFNAFDAHGKMLPLAKVIEQLKEKTKGMSDEKKADAISTIFGTEALSGMLALMDAGPQKINTLTDSFKKSDGEAKKMAKTMQDNNKSAFEQFMGSLETLAIRLNDIVKGPMGGFLTKATDFVNKLSKMDEATLKSGLSMAGFAAAIGPALIGFGGLFQGVGKVETGVGSALKKMGELNASGITNLKSFGDKAKGAFGTAGTAIDGFLNKNNVVSKGMKSMTDGTKNAFAKLGSKKSAGLEGVSSMFAKGFDKLPEAIKGPLTAAGNTVGGFAPTFTSKFKQLGGAATSGLQSMLGIAFRLVGPAAIIGLLLVGLGVANQQMGGQLAAMIQKITTQGPVLIKNFVDGLLKQIPTLIDSGVQLLGALVNALIANLPVIIQGAAKLVAALVEGVTRNLPTLIPMVINLLLTVLMAIIQNLPIILNAGLQLLIGLINGIVNNLPMIINAIVTLIITLVQVIAENLPTIIQAGIQILVALIQGLAIAIPLIIQAMPQIFAAIWNALTTMNWGEIGWAIITGIGEGIKAAAGGIWNILKSIGESAISIVKTFLGIASPSKKFRDEIGKFIPAGIAAGIEDNKGVVDKQLAEMANGMTLTPDVKAKMTASLGATIAGNTQQQAGPQAAQQALGAVNNTQTIVVPVNLDGRVIAEVVAENQKFIDRFNNRAVGGAAAW